MDKSFEKYIYDMIENYIENTHRHFHAKFITKKEHDERVAVLRDLRYKFIGRHR